MDTFRYSDIHAGSCNRKANKPLVEKRRRERINVSLNQIKELVLHATKKNSAEYSKMEKADILEMTVNYIHSMHRAHAGSASTVTDTYARYRAGFQQCAGSVSEFLQSQRSLSPQLKLRILQHIASCTTTLPSADATSTAQFQPGKTSTSTPSSTYSMTVAATAPATKYQLTQTNEPHSAMLTTQAALPVPAYVPVARSSPISDVPNTFSESAVDVIGPSSPISFASPGELRSPSALSSLASSRASSPTESDLSCHESLPSEYDLETSSCLVTSSSDHADCSADSGRFSPDTRRRTPDFGVYADQTNLLRVSRSRRMWRPW